MAECYESLTVDRCNEMLKVCEGMEITSIKFNGKPWLLIELGQLVTRSLPYSKSSCESIEVTHGSITLMIHSSWRVEKPRSIDFAPSFPKRGLERRLQGLVGLKVQYLCMDQDTREIQMKLSDGRTFRTFMESDIHTQPQWHVFFYDQSKFSLHPIWQGIDVIPCIWVRLGSPCVSYSCDPSKLDIARLNQIMEMYQLPHE